MSCTFLSLPLSLSLCLPAFLHLSPIQPALLLEQAVSEGTSGVTAMLKTDPGKPCGVVSKPIAGRSVRRRMWDLEGTSADLVYELVREEGEGPQTS